MPRRKQIYKITYPNGKIYVGMDLTGTILYFGSPSAHEQIAADLGIDAYPLELMLRKEILWESQTATDAEVRAMEIQMIKEHRSNDPTIGYNLLPRLTAAENVALPLIEYTDWSPADRDDIVRLKLALVGLSGFDAGKTVNGARLASQAPMSVQ